MALTDGQLLERFARHRDEAAFEALVARHGPMVMGVCRRALGPGPAAEDVFQAVFLVLARRPAAVRGASAGPWLYTVARRLAAKQRAGDRRRQTRERRAAALRPTTGALEGILAVVAWRELRPILDEELGQLPDRCRAPLVLCYLEGKSQAEAARELGWPATSLARRLEKGRALLRQRLDRRGLGFAAALVGTGLAERTAAAVPAALAAAALRHAVAYVTGAADIPPDLVLLTKGALQTMTLPRILTAVLTLALTVLVAGGLGYAVLAQPGPAGGGRANGSGAEPPPALRTHQRLVQAVLAPSEGPTQALAVPAGGICLLNLPRPLVHGRTGDEARLLLTTFPNQKQLLLSGLTPGRTDLELWLDTDAAGKVRIYRYRVEVTADPKGWDVAALSDGDRAGIRVVLPATRLEMAAGESRLIKLAAEPFRWFTAGPNLEPSRLLGGRQFLIAPKEAGTGTVALVFGDEAQGELDVDLLTVQVGRAAVVVPPAAPARPPPAVPSAPTAAQLAARLEHLLEVARQQYQDRLVRASSLGDKRAAHVIYADVLTGFVKLAQSHAVEMGRDRLGQLRDEIHRVNLEAMLIELEMKIAPDAVPPMATGGGRN